MLVRKVGALKLDIKNLSKSKSKSNEDKSLHALHILQENHKCGPTKEIINILKLQNKGKQLDSYERFHIYKQTIKSYELTACRSK
jgi:hypothetical protein